MADFYTINQLLEASNQKTIKNFPIWRLVKDGKNTFIAENPKNFAKLAADGYEIHEVYSGKFPVRFHLDLDFDKEFETAITAAGFETSKEFIQFIVNMAEVVASEYSIYGTTSGSMRTTGYETDKKLSRHIVFDDVILSCGRENKFLLKELVAKISALYPEISSEIKKTIDPVGSAGFGFMRMPGCGKAGDMTRSLVDVDDFDGLRNLIKGKFIPIQAYGKNPNVSIIEEEAEAEAMAVVVTEEVKELIRLCGELYPEYAITKGSGEGIKSISISRRRPSYCHVCQRNHSSMGAFLAIRDDIPRICCFAALKNNKRFVKNEACIVRAHPKFVETPALKNKYSPLPEDSINSITVDHEVVNSPRCTDGIEDNFKDSYIISAPWAAGKSHFMTRAIENAKNNNIPVITISSRKTLSYQQAEEWGLINYDDITGNHNVKTHPRTNWQLESIPRVNISNVAGCLLIIDEITALSHHGATSFEGRLCLNYLSHIIGVCSRYIVCDNDINDYHIISLNTAAPNIKPKIVRNTKCKYEGIKCEIFQGGNSHALADLEIFQHLQNNINNYKNGLDYEPICVCTHSRKLVNTFVEKFNRMFPGNSDAIAAYTAETDDEVKRRDFSNSTEAWKNKLIVIYSPTVSIGISCMNPRIKKVFAIYLTETVSAQQSAQALFRCRSVEEIRMYVPRKGAADHMMPKNEEEFINYVCSTGDIGIDILGFADYKGKSEISRTFDNIGKELNTFVGKLYTSAMIQKYRSKNSFISEITGILGRAGIKVTVTNVKVMDKMADHDREIMQQNNMSSLIHKKSAEEKRINEMISGDNKKLKERGEFLLNLYTDRNFSEMVKIQEDRDTHYNILALTDKHEEKIQCAREFNKFERGEAPPACDAIEEITQRKKIERFTIISKILKTECSEEATEEIRKIIVDKAYKVFDDVNISKKMDNWSKIINTALKFAGMKIIKGDNGNYNYGYVWPADFAVKL